jgi:hypothetical protein
MTAITPIIAIAIVPAEPVHLFRQRGTIRLGLIARGW